MKESIFSHGQKKQQESELESRNELRDDLEYMHQIVASVRDGLLTKTVNNGWVEVWDASGSVILSMSADEYRYIEQQAAISRLHEEHTGRPQTQH